jgi:adenylate cyclase
MAGPLPSPEELAAAGLYDPDAPDAVERLNHLRLIAARGGTVADMQAAHARGVLDRLVPELLFLPPGPRLTIAELARRAGVDVAEVRELRRACGLPSVPDDEPRFTEGDVRLIGAVDAAADLFGRPAALQLLRVVASSMARVADAAVSTFVSTVGAASMADDVALAEANATAAGLFRELSGVMDTLLRQHVIHLARPNITEASAGFERRSCAIGFVDVVGSTSLSQRLSLDEVGRAIAGFESVAADVVTSCGGRVIKFVGDEVMFRTETAGDACRVAIELVERFGDDPVLPGVRAGVAAGVVLVRDGDCFGPVVNLAARAVKAAAPRKVVLASPGSFDPADDLRLVPLPPEDLAGFEDPVALAEVTRP